MFFITFASIYYYMCTHVMLQDYYSGEDECRKKGKVL